MRIEERRPRYVFALTRAIERVEKSLFDRVKPLGEPGGRPAGGASSRPWNRPDRVAAGQGSWRRAVPRTRRPASAQPQEGEGTHPTGTGAASGALWGALIGMIFLMPLPGARSAPPPAPLPARYPMSA